MDHTIACPACKAAITVNQLFWTGTLVRFKCPHCATRVQPTHKSFAGRWLVISAVVGLLAGLAASMIPRLALGAAERVLAYIVLMLLIVAAIGVIKWRASLMLIRKGQLKVAT